MFVLLGVLFLLGLATDVLGRRTALPRVTLLLLLGILLGPSALGWIEVTENGWPHFVTNLALVMVGFLLGGSLSLRALREHGRAILYLSVGKALGAFAIVFSGLLVVGAGVETALLLGAVATSTAPAVTADVVHADRAEGAFTRRLLGVVAVDDAWGLIVFGVALAVVEAMGGAGPTGALAFAAWDLGGAIALGLGLGIPAAFLTGRVASGEPTQAEALGIVFLCAGLALQLEVSFLLAAMVMGATVANLAQHHRRPFHAIEGIEWPFMILFFALAGASLELGALASTLGLVVAYVGLRAAGTFLGAVAGSVAAGDAALRGKAAHWMGLSLMPQAGVALGMALVATQRLPEVGPTLLPVVVASTALFELVGPILTRKALASMGEAHPAQDDAPGTGS
ncbi:MAG: cation:proton antiporter [Deltaproteobacteria bacterium]|nr:cation:proton antiporter [Deltaproteobacteria bacterium]MBW2361701.1 cation:proton antiporter [Deltaproteobacteria bacterium]